MSTSTATAYEYSVAGHLSFGAPKCEKAQKTSGFWANRTYWLCIKDYVLIDSIDTIAENDIMPFKGVLNEFYSKDISKKVHSSYYLKATQGKFTGCVAPIGYKKDPEDKNHLIIDEETEYIPKMIFEMAAEGHGANYIRSRKMPRMIPHADEE